MYVFCKYTEIAILRMRSENIFLYKNNTATLNTTKTVQFKIVYKFIGLELRNLLLPPIVSNS